LRAIDAKNIVAVAREQHRQRRASASRSYDQNVVLGQFLLRIE
jgi:hypothetical protein